MPDWFGIVPQAEVVIEPYAPFQEKSAPLGQYSSPAADGSRPGLYLINTYQPERQSRAGVESVAFHEAYPGHHLQGTIALERTGAHPVMRYFFVSGFGLGWMTIPVAVGTVACLAGALHYHRAASRADS